MMENKLFSKKWIYKNVFNLSNDDSEELLDQIVEDSKQMWRFKSIEEEGNDPAKPFQKINPAAEGGPGGGGGRYGRRRTTLLDLGGPGDELPDLGGGPGGGGELPPLQEAKVKGNVNHAKWHQMNDAYDKQPEVWMKNRANILMIMKDHHKKVNMMPTFNIHLEKTH